MDGDDWFAVFCVDVVVFVVFVVVGFGVFVVVVLLVGVDLAVVVVVVVVEVEVFVGCAFLGCDISVSLLTFMSVSWSLCFLYKCVCSQARITSSNRKTRIADPSL